MLTSDFDFNLPPELIAQHPAAERDQSRLLVLHRESGRLEHQRFPDLLRYLRPGDVLVLNNSRVIRARMHGRNTRTGGRFEILLLEQNNTNDWWAMMKPGKRARVGTRITVPDQNSSRAVAPPTIVATVMDINEEGHRRVQFTGVPDIIEALDSVGELPLPPYIHRDDDNPSPRDDERYQTVYAQPAGSVAAPTAGLHFTGPRLDQIRRHGVEIHFVTLHVGLGTFAPVKAKSPPEHVMHEEAYEVSETTAAAINQARREGRRIIAVGTTSVRVLESAARPGLAGDGEIQPGPGRTNIFIYPPAEFRMVNALLTNFHLPCSTLLMLVSAFATPGSVSGRELILNAYAAAVRERYRFFSYGDAMLIL